MGKIISSTDYTGTSLEKAFIPNSLNEDSIRKELKLKLEKGVIGQPLYESAVKELETILEKAGEGSKGGKVIGHTSSGKPIYESGKHSDYGNFHEYDHSEASMHHYRKSDEQRVKKNSYETLRSVAEDNKDRDEVKKYSDLKKDAEEKEKHHSAQGQYHQEESKPQSVKDRYSEIGKKVDGIRKS